MEERVNELVATAIPERSDVSFGLTQTQLATLGTLDRHGAMTLGELAAHEKVQPPSMTRIVSSLEQRRLVARDPDREDGRRVVVSITGAARTLLEEDRRRRDAWLARSLRELTAAERDALRRATPVLEKLARL